MYPAEGKESKQKEIALHAMDLVYTRSDHPVGLLGRPITKEELVLLAELMSCDLVSQNEDTLELTSMLPRMRALELLEALTSDHWWTPVWGIYLPM